MARTRRITAEDLGLDFELDPHELRDVLIRAGRLIATAVGTKGKRGDGGREVTPAELAELDGQVLELARAVVRYVMID